MNNDQIDKINQYMDQDTKKFLKVLKITNALLIIAIILQIFYIMIAPYWGNIAFNAKKVVSGGENEKFIYKSSLTQSLGIDDSKLEDIPNDNRIVIPVIGTNSQILEGDESVLDLGLWRRPNSGTPGSNTNVVITGHRFQYTYGPKTFYNLDKLNLGDKIIVYWKGEEHIYEVQDKFEVTPDKVEIEQNNGFEELTLYTCTPILTAERRLVIKAKPI